MTTSWRIEGRIPPIKAVMRPFPFSLESEAPVERARSMMAEHEIRHLPVHEAERLVGIVTERDLRGVDGARPVSAIMSAPAVHVEMDHPLDEVLLTLAEGRIGSVLVIRGGRVAGIFTTTDACRLLGEALHRLSSTGANGDDVA